MSRVALHGERVRVQQLGPEKDFLFVDGAWRDHVLTSLTSPDHPGPSA